MIVFFVKFLRRNETVWTSDQHAGSLWMQRFGFGDVASAVQSGSFDVPAGSHDDDRSGSLRSLRSLPNSPAFSQRSQSSNPRSPTKERPFGKLTLSPSLDQIPKHKRSLVAKARVLALEDLVRMHATELDADPLAVFRVVKTNWREALAKARQNAVVSKAKHRFEGLLLHKHRHEHSAHAAAVANIARSAVAKVAQPAVANVARPVVAKSAQPAVAKVARPLFNPATPPKKPPKPIRTDPRGATALIPSAPVHETGGGRQGYIGKDAGSREATLVLHYQILDIPEGSLARQQFCEKFKYDISNAMGGSLALRPERVNVTSITAGSVVVRFTIKSTNVSKAMTAAEAFEELQQQLARGRQPGIPLLRGDVTHAVDAVRTQVEMMMHQRRHDAHIQALSKPEKPEGAINSFEKNSSFEHAARVQMKVLDATKKVRHNMRVQSTHNMRVQPTHTYSMQCMSLTMIGHSTAHSPN
jgi:hypothetical protein